MASPVLSPRRREELLRLYEAGETTADIAVAMGTSRATVQYHARKTGLADRRLQEASRAAAAATDPRVARRAATPSTSCRAVLSDDPGEAERARQLSAQGRSVTYIAALLRRPYAEVVGALYGGTN